MKFKLSTAGNIYKKDVIEKYTKLGFTFRYDENNGKYWINNEDDVFIEFSSLEELVNCSIDLKESLVIDAENIVIYDDYLE